MRRGDVLRFRGPSGAPFVVTVGPAMDERTIQARIDAGEWTPLDKDAAPAAAEDRPKHKAKSQPEPASSDAKADPGRPAQAAPKAEWIAYVARRGLMAREDAENYTKADLIEIAS